MTDTNLHERETEGKHLKGQRKFRQFLPFVVILLVVLGVVIVAAYRDGTGFDVLHRFFSYGRTEKKNGEVIDTFDSSSENRFAVLDDSLVVLSNRELRVLNGEGKEAYSVEVKMTSPALVVGNDCAVAYDVGGTQLYVVNQDKKLLSLTTKESEPLIAATLNNKDWLAVTTEKKNYKGCVTVYNDQMKKVFAFKSSERFVMNAYVTDNCKKLASVTLGQEDSTFVSNMVLYDLTKTAPKANYDVRDGLVVAVKEISSSLATISDKNLTFASERGKITGTYSYSDKYLREYSLNGNDFAVLLLNRYQSGNVGKLVTVGTNAKKIASLDVNEEVSSISVTGRYIAVLYADRLVIYNKRLKEYATLSDTGYAKNVLMRTDGSALIISADRAKLYLP